MCAVIRMGFIGSGHVLQEIHLPLFSQMEEVLPLVLCDLRDSALKNALRKFGIRETTKHWQDVLAIAEVDAVLITLPNDLHAQVAQRALLAGKHVLCEKPAALDVSGARAVEKAMHDSGSLYMMALPHRFDAEVSLLRQMIAAGRLGRIHHIRAGLVRRNACPGGWFTDRERSGGGALIQFGSHLVDLVAWLMDFPRIERVSAVAYQKDGGIHKWATSATPKSGNHRSPVYDVEDDVTVLMRMDGGRSAVIETAWAQNTGSDRQYLEIYGEKAGASLWPLQIFGELDGVPVDIAPRYTPATNYALLARHFIDCILRYDRREPVRPLGSAEDGVRLAWLTEHIYQSAEAGREIELEVPSAVASRGVLK